MNLTFYVLNTSLSGNKAKRVLATWLAPSTVGPLLAAWHQEDHGNLYPLFPRKTGREVGSQARRLAYCWNWLFPQPLSELSRELMWSCQAFQLCRAFQQGMALSASTQSTWGCSTRFWKMMVSSAQENTSYLHIHFFNKRADWVL